MSHIVAFSSLGVTLRGNLYLPENTDQTVPIVVMAHGFSATISGMVADRYAESFRAAGFAVLLYDHRSLGVSDGKPRQHINTEVQTRGYIDAIDFVTTLPEIDQSRIAIWGDSTSGAEVIIVGAVDDRVGAIVSQVPGCGDVLPPPDPDGSRFNAFREDFLGNDFEFISEKIGQPMPVVSFDQIGTPSIMEPLTSFRWFIEFGGRYGTNWKNWATVSSQNFESFNTYLCAPYLKAPILMIIAEEDEMPGASSEISRKVYEVAPEPKELFEIGGGHFGLLYYPSGIFDQSSKKQVDFLVRHFC
jgi:pimeloyl-ACP methyl ester carboxylesterase